MSVLLVIGVASTLILTFVGLYLILRGLELAFPAFKAFLDRHFPEPDQDIWK